MTTSSTPSSAALDRLPSSAARMLGVFIALSAAFLLADLAGAPTVVSLPLKTSLMLVLAVVVRLGTRGSWLQGAGALAVTALLFSSLGDALLELPGVALFAAGIAAFLCAQACYVVAFRRPPGPGLVGRRPWLLVPVVAYWLLMNLALTESGPLRIPVLVYSAVILAMVAAAIDLRGRVDPNAAGTVLAGALFFALSDSLIAVGRFTTWGEFPGRGSAVMVTYLVGQGMIALGLCAAARRGPQRGTTERG